MSEQVIEAMYSDYPLIVNYTTEKGQGEFICILPDISQGPIGLYLSQLLNRIVVVDTIVPTQGNRCTFRNGSGLEIDYPALFKIPSNVRDVNDFMSNVVQIYDRRLDPHEPEEAQREFRFSAEGKSYNDGQTVGYYKAMFMTREQARLWNNQPHVIFALNQPFDKYSSATAYG